MPLERINPATRYDGSATGMSQVVLDTDTGLLFISGQVDWDKGFQLKNHSMEAQTRNALNKLITVLTAAHSSVAQILQLRIYVRCEVSEHMATIMPLVANTLGVARSALTGIGVASLASPGTLIEIEAVAKVKTA